ncbi:MotE family protein [Aureimonas sp. AU12]|uniref:MotE family protein n=1 Tax=Aureimonas sp. AU12 TaxID=1638161 RepID=UPI0007822C26|nr:MotE family protein [Aureimonas sp. AU12]
MTTIPRFPLALAAASLLALAAAFPARAEEKPGGEAPPVLPPQTVRVVGPDGQAPVVAAVPATDVENYCRNIADPALDQRNALQMVKLKEAEGLVTAKIDELETKRREVQDWLVERKAFMDSTSSVMIDIYAAMKPDAAAAQLAGLDRPVAAALLARLKSRQASAILSEMPAPVAAEIGRLIVQKTDRAAVAGAAPTGQSL